MPISGSDSISSPYICQIIKKLLTRVYFSGVAKQLEPGIDILSRASPYVLRNYITIQSKKAVLNVKSLTNWPEQYLILS